MLTVLPFAMGLGAYFSMKRVWSSESSNIARMEDLAILVKRLKIQRVVRALERVRKSFERESFFKGLRVSVWRYMITWIVVEMMFERGLYRLYKRAIYITIVYLFYKKSTNVSHINVTAKFWNLCTVACHLKLLFLNTFWINETFRLNMSSKYFSDLFFTFLIISTFLSSNSFLICDDFSDPITVLIFFFFFFLNISYAFPILITSQREHNNMW